jgi:hypothetical protein
MGAVIRITDRPYTVIVRTGSKEPGLGKMATISKGPPKSLELQLDYSLLPGPDRWKGDVQGLLPVSWGMWEMEEEPLMGGKTAFLSGQGIGRFLCLRPYPAANGDNYFRTWPDNPFRKGLLGEGHRMHVDIRTWTSSLKPRSDLNPDFAWECLSVD